MRFSVLAPVYCKKPGVVWLVISGHALFALASMKSLAPDRSPLFRYIRVFALLLAGVGGAVIAEDFPVNRALLSTRDLTPIFNGTNLDGWIIRGGKATYAAADGVIVGTCAVKGGGNTFLCTEKEYGDFILELEIKADNGLNSGVQIRSHCFDEATTYDFGNRVIKVPAKRVHGYQVEVDHRPERRWSGGIYEEARRDWLFPLGTNSSAGKAFKFGEWNKYRIECRGASIKTWVNDVPAADLVDAEALKGFIGLQVHSADKPEYQVRFRNIRLKDLGQQEWRTAWDCRSFDGTEQQGAGEWKLTDGVLLARHASEESSGGALVGGAALSDFVIRFKYKLVKGEFALTFRAPSGDQAQSVIHIPFTEQMGATNFARLQDWNTVTVSVRKQRVVAGLNGHQFQDAVQATLPLAVRPALQLAAHKEAEVFFKDFEILGDPQ